MDINKLKSMIGNKVYELRMQHDLTQEEFAQKLGTYVSKGHISKIESGSIMPSAEFIRSVCIAFNISPYWLLSIHSPLNQFPPKEEGLLNAFRNLPIDSQEIIINLINIMNKSS